MVREDPVQTGGTFLMDARQIHGDCFRTLVLIELLVVDNLFILLIFLLHVSTQAKRLRSEAKDTKLDFGKGHTVRQTW